MTATAALKFNGEMRRAAVLQHIRRVWDEEGRASTTQELFELFGPDDGGGQHRAQALHRFGKLLQKWHDQHGHPCKGPDARRGLGAQQGWLPAAATRHAAATSGARVPARQVDVMHGPTYQPTPVAHLRPGAQDALRLPSRGVRC